ncbi:unnamed protein product [Rotaria socialis]|uniref:G-protein coupled receptors family 1 profile domain-containing protein n=1 Tax=Rotaria socialis TaxID=392032 RepID=A0A820H833_9BILA|nr:unnamed protein product [Rotaria socialis]CAF3330072.1 unnamed protein product [Rotaria socialis]CAF3342336.1 unnamed protein product [Rotaria socialis]CAF3361822.1 unnamed protein product [Rotaria socialis]CAF3610329.1 unnamed protein product [Rotaria socialis]
MNNTVIDSFASNNDATNNQQTASFILDLRFFLVRIFYPSLLIWGTIGNSLCLRVLLSKKFYQNSTCQYLAVLAVIDILFIVMRSSKHVYKLFRDTTIFNTSKWMCRILTFFSSALAHMGSWILVIVSFDRYFIVTSRYRRRSSSFHQVLCSTSILIAIVVLCNIYYFFILGRSVTLGKFGIQDQRRFIHRLLMQSNETSINSTHSLNYPSSDLFRYKTSSIFVCIPSTRFEIFFRTYIPIFDILLVAAIPFLLLCFTNIGIITFTMRNNRQMRQHRKRAHRRHQRLTIMLLSVTLAFIGLTCPSVIFICVNKIIYSGRILTERKDNLNADANIRQPSHVQLIVDICEALWYTKHAMNFILYTLNGQDFRREFLKLFTQCFTRRSTAVRKLLNKTQTRTSIDESTIDTQLRVTNRQSKIFHEIRSNEQPIADNDEISSAIFVNSNSVHSKSVTDDKYI